MAIRRVVNLMLTKGELCILENAMTYYAFAGSIETETQKYNEVMEELRRRIQQMDLDNNKGKDPPGLKRKKI